MATRKRGVVADEMYVALEAFVDTIELTGGVTSNRRGELVPMVDRNWVDLGDAYVQACAALKRDPKIVTKKRG